MQLVGLAMGCPGGEENKMTLLGAFSSEKYLPKFTLPFKELKLVSYSTSG